MITYLQMNKSIENTKTLYLELNKEQSYFFVE